MCWLHKVFSIQRLHNLNWSCTTEDKNKKSDIPCFNWMWKWFSWLTNTRFSRHSNSDLITVEVIIPILTGVCTSFTLCHFFAWQKRNPGRITLRESDEAEHIPCTGWHHTACTVMLRNYWTLCGAIMTHLEPVLMSTESVMKTLPPGELAVRANPLCCHSGEEPGPPMHFRFSEWPLATSMLSWSGLTISIVLSAWITIRNNNYTIPFKHHRRRVHIIVYSDHHLDHLQPAQWPSHQPHQGCFPLICRSRPHCLESPVLQWSVQWPLPHHLIQHNW